MTQIKVGLDELICTVFVETNWTYGPKGYPMVSSHRCKNKKVRGVRGGLPMCWIHVKQFDNQETKPNGA